MAKHLTEQQEIFCHEIIKGKSQFAAYQVAYPVSIRWNRALTDSKASLLMDHEKIKARIERLRAPIIRKTLYTALEAHEEAGKAFEGAMGTQQYGAAVAAVTLRAKLHGLITEKREVKVTKLDDYDASDKTQMLEMLQAEFARRKALNGPDDVSDVEPK